MKKHFTKITLIISQFVTTIFLSSKSVLADIDCNDGNIPEDVKIAAGCGGDNTNALPNSIITIINAIIGVLGLLAVVYIIYGGVQYMTSAGDAGKAKKAKDTILYAVIGLIVCVLAFAIVNFVINNFF